jgi:hypothetical protein
LEKAGVILSTREVAQIERPIPRQGCFIHSGQKG